MKKNISLLIILVIFLFSCSENRKNEKLIFHADREAPLGWLHLKLFEDSTFNFISKGIRSEDVYTGKFSLSADTLILKYNDSVPAWAAEKFILSKNSIVALDKPGGFQIRINEINIPVVETKIAERKIQVDQATFGIYCGECIQHCATLFHCNFMGNQNSFSADYTDSFFKKRQSLIFGTQLNKPENFAIADSIIQTIPDSLFNSTESKTRYGCPDCADGCGIYFSIVKQGVKKEFLIDYQTNNLSGQVKIFAEFLKKEISRLEAINQYKN